jgi:hypothetical protein
MVYALYSMGRLPMISEPFFNMWCHSSPLQPQAWELLLCHTLSKAPAIVLFPVPPPTAVKIDVILLFEGTIWHAMCKSPAGFLFLVFPTAGVIWCYSTTWWNCLHTLFKAAFLLPVSSTASIILSYSTTWSNWLPHTVRSTCRIPKCWQNFYMFIFISCNLRWPIWPFKTFHLLPDSVTVTRQFHCSSEKYIGTCTSRLQSAYHNIIYLLLSQNVLKLPHKQYIHMLWIYTRLIHKVSFPGAVYRNKTQLHGNIYCNSVQLFFNIFATRIETFVIPWDQLLYTVS